MKLTKSIWPFLFITIVVAIFFYPIWLKKMIPLPADALVAIHVPWTEVKWHGYPAGVPFKNGEITDSISQFYPWRSLVGEYWREGKVPLWNPYMFSGVPLLATLHSSALYPLNIIYLFLPDVTAWTGLIVLQIFLSGIFMYLFLKKLDLTSSASVLGALAFAFCGYMIAWLEFAAGGHAGLWLPLLLYLEINLIQSSKVKWILPTAIVFLFIFTAGDFQVPAYSVITYLLFGFYLIGFRSIINLKCFKLISLMVLGLFFGILLSLPQLLPTFELFSQSMRGSDPYIREYFYGLMDWSKITNFIWPDFYGNVTTGNYWARFGFNEYISFTGIISILLTVYAIFTKKLKREIFFIILFVISLLFLFPTPFGFLPFNLHIPAFSTSSASRIIFLVDFCLAVLGAYGFSKWSTGKNNKLLKISVLFLLITLIIVLLLVVATRTNLGLFGFLSPKMLVNLTIALRNMVPTTLIVVALTIVLIGEKIIITRLCYKKLNRLMVFVIPFIVLLFSATELLRFSWKFVSFSPPQFNFPQTETIKFLSDQQKPFRITGGIPTNLFMPFKLSSAEGYDSMYPLRYAEWISAIETKKIDSPRRRYGLIKTFSSPLLNYNNVEYVIDYKKGEFGDINKEGSFDKALLNEKFQPVFSENRVTVFRNTTNLPRVWLTTNYKVITEKQLTINELEDIENQRNRLVVLEQEPPINVDNNKLISEIKNYQDEKDTIKMDVITSENSLLFISQNYYPGWKAFVDKTETPVMRSNYTFQAVAIPRGEHTVKLIYQPQSFKIGFTVSLITLIILILHFICISLFPNLSIAFATFFSKKRRI